MIPLLAARCRMKSLIVMAATDWIDPNRGWWREGEPTSIVISLRDILVAGTIGVPLLVLLLFLLNRSQRRLRSWGLGMALVLLMGAGALWLPGPQSTRSRIHPGMTFKQVQAAVLDVAGKRPDKCYFYANEEGVGRAVFKWNCRDGVLEVTFDDPDDGDVREDKVIRSIFRQNQQPILERLRAWAGM